MASRSKGDRGYALIFVAFLLLPMVAMVGLAVDVGSFYVRAAKIQRASDAAALAGVIHQPDSGLAESTAIAVAKENGFDPTTDPDIEIIVEDLGGQQLRVTIFDRDVDVFFSSIFLSNVEIVRFSSAEFVLPVPMGSPLNSFGNTQPVPAAGDPQFWAAIQAPFTRYEDGDPYATGCNTVPPFTNPTLGIKCQGVDINPGYRPEGYWYGVEVTADQVGLPVAVEVFDGGFYQRSSIAESTGDFVWRADLGRKPDTGYQLYDIDSTTLDYRNNPQLPGCKLEIEAETGGYKDTWATICVITPTRPGIFPLRVYTSSSAFGSFPAGWDSEGQGFNSYALRTTCALCLEQPRLYGLGEMSILNNVGSGAVSEFFLAEVAQRHSGKTLQIRMFDPGDGSSGDFDLTLIAPSGNPQQGCGYKSDADPPADPLTQILGDCTIITRVDALPAGTENVFNGQWLTIEVPLTSYTCTDGVGNGCWWKVKYNFPASATPTDRTVWQVRVIGDPVRLVPG
ncbi:MAG: pilus assembly protein TadG-related protein [Acidimicrobiales bacterium]